jgi:hypothetical protein
MYFCVVGTGRCGSSMLRDLLNLHPQLFVFLETHWIPKMYELFGTGPADTEMLNNVVLNTYHVSGARVTTLKPWRVRAWARELGPTTTVVEYCEQLGRHCAEREGKRFWADKTPDYGPYMETLQRLWPECRFIHLIRDGVVTALSMSGHDGFRWMATAGDDWWVPVSFNGYYEVVAPAEQPLEAFVGLWYRRLQRNRNEASRLRDGSYLEVRLEALAAKPVATLESIAHFVGLESPQAWLQAAAALVDPNRLSSRTDQTPAPKLTLREQELLEELGYA